MTTSGGPTLQPTHSTCNSSQLPGSFPTSRLWHSRWACRLLQSGWFSGGFRAKRPSADSGAAVQCHGFLPRRTLCHAGLYGHILPCHAVSCPAVLYQLLELCRAVPCRAVPCCAVILAVMAVRCHAVQRHGTLCYAGCPCWARPRCAVRSCAIVVPCLLRVDCQFDQNVWLWLPQGVDCGLLLLTLQDVRSEGAARAWRYEELRRMAQEGGWGLVATGHTATDRAETLLLNLLRGSGADGLQVGTG